MPLYMDVHHLPPETTPEMIEDAHVSDLAVQEGYDVRYLGYWHDRDRGTVTCMVEGPSREACEAVHAEAHGLMAEQIIEVTPTTIDAFLGAGAALQDGVARLPDGRADGGLRVILVTQIANLEALAAAEGDAAALRVRARHDAHVREALLPHEGREVRHLGDGVMLSFVSASAAVRCALAIRRACVADASPGSMVHVRIGLSAGEPVSRHRELFGVAVDQARALCRAAEPGTVLVSTTVRDLCAGKELAFGVPAVLRLPGIEAPFEGVEALGEAGDVGAAGLRLAWHALSSFAAQLRKRKVVRVAAAYVIAFLAVLQVTDLILDPLGMTRLHSVIVVSGLAGFPMALVLAWVFEVTPTRGIRRTVD